MTSGLGGYQVGDEVILKSNPETPMTVVGEGFVGGGASGSPGVMCEWLNAAGDLQTHSFPGAALKPSPGLVQSVYHETE